MQEKKETSIQIKIDKSVSKQLKNLARQKDYKFSAYIRKILNNQIQKEKKVKQLNESN